MILLANDNAAREAGGDAPVTEQHLIAAVNDYFPSRDVELRYMELLAVFEASSRRLLPAEGQRGIWDTNRPQNRRAISLFRLL